MGSELLIEDGESKGGSGETSESPFSIAKMIDDCFPYYLSIGMSYDEYWNGDPSLVRAYREAEKLRVEQKNRELWLHGRYIYEGIACLIPAFNQWKPKNPIPYMDEPYALTEEEWEKRQIREQKKKQEELRNYMMSFVKKKEEKKDG